MSIRCPRCFRPSTCCLCKYTREIDSGIKFVLLMHIKEAKKQRTGTGRLTKISLKDCEIFEGIDFTQNKRLNELLSSKEYFPVLLYPSEDAWTVKKENFTQTVNGRKILAIIIDSTWSCSRSIIKKNAFLLDLPKFSFAGDYRSIFTFKREPTPQCISTIETCYYLIKELQTVNLANKDANPEPMMNVFKQMIKEQLQAENERIAGLRPNTHPKDFRYTKKKEIPDF